jgi:glucokinase
VTDERLTVGVDIGGTKVLAGVVDAHGHILARARRDTPADDAAKTLDFIVEVVKELAAVQPVSAVGIGAAGWINESRSTVLFAPNLAWRNEPLRDRVAERTGLPVVVENDANAAAWAEFQFGAAREQVDSMTMLTIGTGIGGGLVIGGRLIRGAHGMAAEMGHVRVVPDGHPCPCGRHGCLEQYASGNALVRYARVTARDDPGAAAILLDLASGSLDAITGPLVTRAAQQGDPASLSAFATVAAYLGSGLADLAQLLDPQVLVVGGGVIEAGELLMVPTQAAYHDQLQARGMLPVATVVAASMGNAAGLVGAADLARR